MVNIDYGLIKDILLNGFGRVTVFFLIIIFTFILNKIVRKLMNNHFNKASKVMRVDKTQYNFLKHFTSAVIIIVGLGLAIYSVPSLRTISISLFAGAGILAIIIGFASQQAFSNIISGIMITVFQPFRVDDRIKIGADLRGHVEDITLRHTVIRNFENKRIIVPNSVISNEIIENSHIGEEKTMKSVEFGISYDSDIDKAMKIMQKEAEKHAECMDNRSKEDIKEGKPVVQTKVVGFTDSSVVLRAWVWAKDPNKAFSMGNDLNRSIKLEFDKKGIEIPYPYRTIVYKKDIEKKKK